MENSHAKRLGTFPSAYGTLTRLAYEHAKASGVDPKPLLKKSNMTLYQIEDAGLRLAVQDQIVFLNLIASALQDELLGFHLAQSPDLRELGFLYYISASSEFLGDALRHTARYSSIANEGVSLKYSDGIDVCISFQYIGVSRHLDRHQIEFFTVLLLRLARHLTGLRLMPIRMGLAHRRESSRLEFLDFFGVDVAFNAAVDEVVFAPSTKHLPIVSADPHLNRLLIRYSEEALARRPTKRGSFQSTVENAIVPLLPHGKARAGEIARRLGVSQRTFARRLSLEGLTFSDVLESLKIDLAERYLDDDGLSISQIAWLVGYQEVSAFTHAFKRWTGKTPRQTRSRIES